MLLHFNNPSCGCDQHCNLYPETVPLLQSIFTSLFHPYLFTKSSLQSPLTLYSYITQQCFTSLLLRTTIPTIYTKNIFPASKISAIQAVSRDQGTREYCEDWHCFNPSLLPQTMDSESSDITDFLSLRLIKLVYCRCGKPSNPPSLIPSTYFYYFHIQLISSQELTFSWKPAV